MCVCGFFLFFFVGNGSGGGRRGGAGEGINVINIKIDARLVFVLWRGWSVGVGLGLEKSERE